MIPSVDLEHTCVLCNSTYISALSLAFGFFAKQRDGEKGGGGRGEERWKKERQIDKETECGG